MTSGLAKSCCANKIALGVSCALRETRRLACKSAIVASSALSSRKFVPTLRGLPRTPAFVYGSAIVCASSADANVVELQLKVEGMVCDGCSSRVLEALQKLSGVKNVDVDLETGLATVYLEAETQIDAFNALPHMIQTVNELGFEAEPHFD